MPDDVLADERTIAALDFQSIRDRLAALTQTDAGAEAARGLTPSVDRVAVTALLAATSEMRRLIAQGFTLDRVADPGSALARARRANALSGEELRLIGVALVTGDAAARAMRNEDTPALAALVAHVRTVRELGQDLTTSLGPRGEVLDQASPELTRLRRAVVVASDAARQRCLSLLRNESISRALQDATVTMRDNRYVVPIKVEFSSQIPGIVHDTSASGQTVFLEPMATVEMNNRARTARLQEQHEIERILTALTARVAKELATIQHLLRALTAIDIAFARARLAEQMQAHPPILVDTPALQLDVARHPLLGERAVPQSFSLDANQRLILISGPNMGGKTVALKLAGLAILMTACGLHLPAEPTSKIGVFTRVRADIGDAQSIAMNASTFSAHLGRLRDILHVADSGLLFLVDEIAGGTEPAAGAALAIAVLDQLLAAGAHGIVTTHAQELKAYAQQREAVVNAGMRFAPGTHLPTYEIDIGVPGRSLAFDLAEREGLPLPVLEAARALVDQREHSYDRALAELSEARAELSVTLQQAREQRAALHAQRASLEAAERSFERERTAFTERAEQKLSEMLRSFAQELARRGDADKRARVTRSQSDFMLRTLDEMRKELSIEAVDEVQVVSAPIRMGMRVRVRSIGSEGVVTEDLGQSVAVVIGSMRMVVAKNDCVIIETKLPKRRVVSARTEQEEDTHQQELTRIGNVVTEIDVRGKRLAEARELVDRWLDMALLAGYSPLRIIHGKGTGALGVGLQEMLREHPSLTNIRYGNENEGGGGVTILST